MINEIIMYLTIFFGSAMSLSWFFQTKKMYNNKSSKNISPIFITTSWLSIFFFVIYGVMERDITVTIPFGIGLVGISTVLISYIKYKK